MDEDNRHPDHSLSRQHISDAVSDLGWRYVLASLQTYVRVGSLTEAAEVAARVVAVAGGDLGEHLSADLRRDRLVLSLQSAYTESVTASDIDLARRISALVADLGLRTDANADAGTRAVQVLELAIDALDIPSIRPFWKAVLGYRDEASGTALVDPAGQQPAVWFQQMTEPRPQRNRIHVDISVPHDAAQSRIAEALAAGGELKSGAAAPAFWILADAEGNEACITTWQGRDG
ncbi:4a-hydroxytetrahydrobiopterin dehydratase [Amycolatopsis marina]|uniref:4a-hydroxytetrahydrobiopterin dehydratase n=1 Tax=Amycolatopsis marina TaxID=490629 RepID=A0A1I1A6M8_9PSEU|nr:VOC family protein [Amycolatopsis marina]SFB33625.1 4a-hydroxytetrahydrobiopterin dehydratase [Amycolatopsis marina]